MENLKDQKFNNLTAIKPCGNYKRNIIWLCKCDCGKQTKVQAAKLKNNHTKSCGCLKKRYNNNAKAGSQNVNWKGYEEISATFFSRMKSGAKLRDLEWSLSIEYLWELFLKQNKQCAYSGRILNMPINLRQLRNKSDQYLASLDRIDNSKGYIEGNVQWVCKRINYMKHILDEDIFLDFIRDIYNYKIIPKDFSSRF